MVHLAKPRATQFMRNLKPLIFLACFLPLHCGWSDTFTLKDGKTIEGKVIREDDENYVVEVQVTPSIRDEVVIAKKQVRSIRKETVDDKDFERIQGYVPTVSLMSLEEYERRVEMVEKFISEYPNSGHLGKAREILEVLSEEMAVVRGGGIKFGDELISGADYDGNAYEVDSKIAQARIRGAVERRDLMGALRSFSEFEAVFSGSEARASIVPLMKQVLAAQGEMVSSAQESLDKRVAARQLGLERMEAGDRLRSERALEEEREAVMARYQAEKADRNTWITPDVFVKETLDDSARQLEQELRRLENPRGVVAEVGLEEVYRNAWKVLATGTAEEKTQALNEARQARLPEGYLSKLEQRAALSGDSES